MTRIKCLTAVATLCWLGALAVANPAAAAPLKNGNILVSTADAVYEYTPSGTFVRKVDIPYPGGTRPTTESARDLVVTPEGNIELYNGTFEPYLSRYDVATGTWTHRTHPGWSTVNNGSYGGLARFQHYLFATDMFTYGAGDEARGLLRFELNGGGAVRFADFDFADVTVGLDGLVYALDDDRRTIRVYEPTTLAFVRTVSLAYSQDIRGIAVSVAGDIYGASWDDNIYRFSPAGVQLGSIRSGTIDLTDINVSPDGKVVVGSRFGKVLFTDLALSSVRSISVGTSDTFVTFIQGTAATGFASGNLLVTQDGTLAEYTPSGVLVQSKAVPVTEEVRDVTVDHGGGVALYNGTLSPRLSRYNGATGTWAHQTLAGWSTVSTVSSGGVATWQGYTFATDMSTAGGGEPRGLVRFNVTSGTPRRFADTTDFIDVTLGLDGLLYALSSDEATVSVYRPRTQEWVRTVSLPGGAQSIRSLAVSSAGELYGAAWDGHLHRFDAAGAPLGSLDSGALQLVDIDIAQDGRVAAGSMLGQVVLTDLALSGVQSIAVGNSPSFVAFTIPVFSTN